MEGYYDENGFEDMRSTHLPAVRCVHCGKNICEPDEAMIINVNQSTVHMDCWIDYAADNYEEFLSEFYG